MTKAGTSKTVRAYHRELFNHYGPQFWWPGEGQFEVIVGAILTQNTAWSNVEKALRNLKQAGLLNPLSMHKAALSKLARLIRPSGYFNRKADRLKAFLRFLFDEYRGHMGEMFRTDPKLLRQKLLQIKGVGPETADSILLYAGEFPFFVIDTYTRRIFSRHGLVDMNIDYHQFQRWLTDRIPKNIKFYNEFHALIVQVGKEYCRPKPICHDCPLERFLEKGASRIGPEAIVWGK